MRVIVGRVGRPHGIRGELVVAVRTDEPDARFAAGATVEAEQHGTLTIARSRWHSGQLLVAFTGINDRTEAAGLSGVWLSVDTERLPPPEDPDEFRDHELIGLAVRTVAGEPVGVVSDVLHYGQDLLVVRPTQSAQDAQGTYGAQHECLVPFVKAIVPEVNVADGVLVIDPPPGLLELDEAE
ncbi:MAG TPA: ribosome maturation factor RimM [Streptosporangiaceae bacterium]|nr:ribosome maturation factor RimM [Streptosporangiaceae bacterium]